MAEIRMIDSLTLIDRAQWNACFPGQVEDYDYLLSIETAGIAGFSWRYLIAQEAGIVIAAMPAFITDYPLDTTMEGTAKKVTTQLRRILPAMLTLKLACLGSPATECGIAGFHPSLTDSQRINLLQRILQTFEATAFQQGANTIGLKDIPESQEALWSEALQSLDYQQVPALPVAFLPIGFKDMDAYFETLSSSTRKDMRRKLRAGGQLRIERRTTIDDILPRVMELYHDTRNRAEMQFEELTPEYFQNVLHRMPGRAFMTLYYAGGELLAANLLLQDDTTLLDKFFCMDSARGRELNLYFISWFTNIAYCLEHGLPRYQSGQACYENKLRLGSHLLRTAMHFKHRNRLIHGALKWAAPLLTTDYTEEKAA